MNKNVLCASFIITFFFFSCQKEEIADIKETPEKENPILVTIIRTIGDGKDDLLGYGYNALYAAFDDKDGVRNQIVDLDAFESGKAIDPNTGIEVNMLAGKVERTTPFGGVMDNQLFYENLAEYKNSLSTSASADFSKIAPWGKLKMSMFYGYALERMSKHSFYDVNVERVFKRHYLSNTSPELLKYYLTDNFKVSLKNFSGESIINSFGTHLITDIRLGGRLKMIFSGETTSNKTDEFTDISVSIASALQSGINKKIQTSNSIKDFKLRIEQVGSSTIQADKTYIVGGEFDTSVLNYKRWIEEINATTSSILGHVRNNAVGIWKLTDDQKIKTKIIAEILKRTTNNPIQFYLMSESSEELLGDETEEPIYFMGHYNKTSNTLLVKRKNTERTNSGGSIRTSYPHRNRRPSSSYENNSVRRSYGSDGSSRRSRPSIPSSSSPSFGEVNQWIITFTKDGYVTIKDKKNNTYLKDGESIKWIPFIDEAEM
ncbi:MAG: MAC/perforin domain-containing protein [Bacteroides sp.]|uniref:MAC/perforin domain-containing protein n=2 Tax=Bacteroides sp. TaxID=29523 RepID=UPI002FCCA93F